MRPDSEAARDWAAEARAAAETLPPPTPEEEQRILADLAADAEADYWYEVRALAGDEDDWDIAEPPF